MKQKLKSISIITLLALLPDSRVYAEPCNFSLKEENGNIIYTGQPCSLYDALYINNHIQEFPYAGLPLPEEKLMTPLSVQMFIYRESNANREGRSVDYLISSIGHLHSVEKEKIASYLAYIIYTYAEKSGSTDPTGSINEAVFDYLNKSGHKNLAELLCFVELDHPTLDKKSLIKSHQYSSCLER